MFVFPGRIPAVAGSYQSGQIYYLTYGDYFAIRDQARFLRAVSPVLERDDIRAVSDYGSTNGQVSAWFPSTAIFATCRLNLALVQRRGQFAASPGRGSGMGIAEEYVSRPACRGQHDPAERYGF